MREPRDLEEIKEDVADRQRNILWEDARRRSTSVDAFLWKGDPNAKPVQRAGLVVFGICFSLLAVCLASIPFQKDFEGGWAIELLALFPILISIRFIRNACLHTRKPSHHYGQNGNDSGG